MSETPAVSVRQVNFEISPSPTEVRLDLDEENQVIDSQEARNSISKKEKKAKIKAEREAEDQRIKDIRAERMEKYKIDQREDGPKVCILKVCILKLLILCIILLSVNFFSVSFKSTRVEETSPEERPDPTLCKKELCLLGIYDPAEYSGIAPNFTESWNITNTAADLSTINYKVRTGNDYLAGLQIIITDNDFGLGYVNGMFQASKAHNYEISTLNVDRAHSTSLSESNIKSVSMYVNKENGFIYRLRIEDGFGNDLVNQVFLNYQSSQYHQWITKEIPDSKSIVGLTCDVTTSKYAILCDFLLRQKP